VVAAQPAFAGARGLLGLALLRMRRTGRAVEELEHAANLEPANQRIANAYLGALVVKAVQAMRRGDSGQAQQIFAFVLERRPDNLLCHVYMGRIARAAGRPDVALSHYTRASALAPDDAVLTVLLATAALHAGNADVAADALQQVSGLLGPQAGLSRVLASNPDVLARLAALSFFQGRRFREALRAGKAALRADYHDAEMHALVAGAYLALQEPGRARNHFERAQQYGGHTLQTAYGHALALWELRDHEELLRVANRIERLHPGDRTGRYFRALARSATAEADAAVIADLQQALRESGPDQYLMTALARAYLDGDRPDLAVGWLERSLRLDGRHGEAIELLLEAREALDDDKDLLAAYHLYFGRFPDDEETRRHFVRWATGHGLWDEAAAHILALLPRQPASVPLRKMLASCYLMTRRYRDAAVLYRDLLRDDPRSLPLLRALVRCLDRMRSHRSAIRLLEKADPYFKGDIEVLLPLGVLYIKIRDYEHAQATLRRVLDAAPHDWRAHHNLGRAYAKSGQETFAERFFENARKYRPARLKTRDRSL
jgi:tetratricopeptide (TPR) repeat protein